MHWPRGVRARLAGALVLLVAVTAGGGLGGGARLFVAPRLHAQALADARDQAAFDLTVIVPGRQLPAHPTPDDIDRSGLLVTFQQRGVESLVDLGSAGVVQSSDALDGLLGRLPADVPARVGRGELAYAWVDIRGTPSLVVGGLAPGGGPAVYFVRDVGAIEVAVDQLRRALAIGALLALVIALLMARVVARGILAPIEEAGETAERIERGDLLARVPVTSHDEFGSWADRFNRMADTLSETIRRLESAQHQNRRFVADVSHELRTPLTALVAEASIVRGDVGKLPPESRRAAHKAAFSQPSQPIVIEADPRRLERILGNFLDNAKEHAGDKSVEIELLERDDDVVVAVSDRGPGVPADRLEMIFDRFTKVDPSRSGGSSGLGLAIAAEHAALMGGYLQAMGREGGGLRIELVMPKDVAGSLRSGDVTVT